MRIIGVANSRYASKLRAAIVEITAYAGFTMREKGVYWKSGGISITPELKPWLMEENRTTRDYRRDCESGVPQRICILRGGRHHLCQKFDQKFQTETLTCQGRIFAPGVDPFHPEAVPIANSQFTCPGIKFHRIPIAGKNHE